jgi:uncharacterized protein (DUF1330 family)
MPDLQRLKRRIIDTAQRLVLEGDAGAKGIVLFEFPSMAVAKRWYFSDAYQEVRQRRLGAAEFELILVDGELKPAAERMADTR